MAESHVKEEIGRDRTEHGVDEKLQDVSVEADANSADSEHAVDLDPEFVKRTVRRIDRFLVPAMLLGQCRMPHLTCCGVY